MFQRSRSCVSGAVTPPLPPPPLPSNPPPLLPPTNQHRRTSPQPLPPPPDDADGRPPLLHSHTLPMTSSLTKHERRERMHENVTQQHNQHNMTGNSFFSSSQSASPANSSSGYSGTALQLNPSDLPSPPPSLVPPLPPGSVERYILQYEHFVIQVNCNWKGCIFFLKNVEGVRGHTKRCDAQPFLSALLTSSAAHNVHMSTSENKVELILFF